MVGLLTLYSNFSDQGERLRKLLDLPARVPGAVSPRRTIRYRRHLDDAERSELVATYEAGATVYDLAEHFGLHRDTVAQYIKAAGIETRYHATRDVDLDRVDELQRQGLSLTEIAERLHVGRTTLVVARRRSRSG